MYACVPFDHKLYLFDGFDFKLFAFLHDGKWFVYNILDDYDIHSLPALIFDLKNNIESFCFFIVEAFDIDVNINDVMLSQSIIHHDISDLSKSDFSELVTACCYYRFEYVCPDLVSIVVPDSYYDITGSFSCD